MAKDRPILFSAPMVRAILDGSKTQTRRAVKGHVVGFNDGRPCSRIVRMRNGDVGEAEYIMCPYGFHGDLLWVREEHYRFGHWEPIEGAKTKGGRQKWAFVADSDEVLFEPTGDCRKGRHHKDPATPAWHKRLARFMPRRFSRLTLEVVSVRVERLTSISEEDARAEGCRALIGEVGTATARYDFRRLWESINGAGSWDANPWVWVVEFRRVS